MILRVLARQSHMPDVQTTHRRLPHHYAEDRWLFVTWHLHGSLPHGLYPPPGKKSAGQAFVWMDRYLDVARTGPAWLRIPRIAHCTVRSIREGERLGFCKIRAFVVMANHVHVLLFPRITPSKLLQSMKGKSAREANRILGRTGEKFWQAESNDHWVRDSDELERVISYIENNPVKAGLAASAAEYRWSSAFPQVQADVETNLDAAD